MTPAANTLRSATSPYLRQHADNPVHWQQWSPQALAEAADRDVPVLLSVGYAACHWCHVMAHESFADDEVAAAMNADFVCVKVDREERPDIDAVYMNATVALTGHGGWPMTCFLTPDGRPFFCGTYYPKAAFLHLLSAVADTWRNRRKEIEQASDQIVGELRAMASGLPGGGSPVEPALCDHAVAVVLRDEDTARGGFGGRPNFRRPRCWKRCCGTTNAPVQPSRSARCGAPVARWPAVESMTSWPAVSPATASTTPGWCRISRRCCTTTRNCCAVYAHWARRTGDPLAHRVAAETADFIVTGLGAGDMFTSSLDADAGGREGSTYVWTPEQLREVLGGDDGPWAASVFGVTATGTFEDGASVLQLAADPEDTERVRADPDGAAGRAPDPGATWTRRQGRHRMERFGHHRPGRSQCGVGRAGAVEGCRTVCGRAVGICTSWMAGCGGPASAAWSAKATPSSKITRCWPPAC